MAYRRDRNTVGTSIELASTVCDILRKIQNTAQLPRAWNVRISEHDMSDVRNYLMLNANRIIANDTRKYNKLFSITKFIEYMIRYTDMRQTHHRLYRKPYFQVHIRAHMRTLLELLDHESRIFMYAIEDDSTRFNMDVYQLSDMDYVHCVATNVPIRRPDSSCSICLEHLTHTTDPNLTVDELRMCGHQFHHQCLWNYVMRRTRQRCPLCRASMKRPGCNTSIFLGSTVPLTAKEQEDWNNPQWDIPPLLAPSSSVRCTTTFRQTCAALDVELGPILRAKHRSMILRTT